MDSADGGSRQAGIRGIASDDEAALLSVEFIDFHILAIRGSVTLETALME